MFNPDGDPYTVSLASGALPPGIALNPDSSFSGTATAAGMYSATLEVCNTEAGLCTNVEFEVTVTAPATQLDHQSESASEKLPHTGSSTDGWERLAAVLVGLGAMLLVFSRRVGSEE